jgi:hypothetical protein
MAPKPTDDETAAAYAAQAQALLATWQETLQQYWQDPDTLNAWLAHLQPPAPTVKTKDSAKETNADAAQQPVSPDDDVADATSYALRAELARIRRQHNLLKRQYATLAKRYDALAKAKQQPAKSAAKSVKPATKSKSVSKSVSAKPAKPVSSGAKRKLVRGKSGGRKQPRL